MLPPNPYYPLGVEIVGYVPNVWGAFHLVALFAAVCCTVLGVTYGVVKRVRPRIATSELCTVLWFVLCTDALSAVGTTRLTG